MPDSLIAFVTCTTIGTFVLLEALWLANRARTAYKTLFAANAELRRRRARTEAVSALEQHERIAFDVHDALHRDLTSILALISVSRCLVAAYAAGEDRSQDQGVNVHLSQAHAAVLQMLTDVRRAVRQSDSSQRRSGVTVVIERLTRATSSDRSRVLR